MPGQNENIPYAKIIHEIQKGHFKPIYYLMGEEDYYIDKLSEFILNSALNEDEKDFNSNILYGNDVSIKDVINVAREFPVMAKRRVVIIREAQQIKDIDSLMGYLENPLPSTVLVLCHKHGKINRSKKITKKIEEVGVLFESKKYYDSQLPEFVNDYLKRKHISASSKAIQMICEFVGNDLCRIANELEKLILSLPKNSTNIDERLVENVIGISKDYNNFELVDALLYKNELKVNQIVKYFNDNPKNFVLQLTILNIFSSFCEVLIAHHEPTKSYDKLATSLGVPLWKVRRKIMPALGNYSEKKTTLIISYLREIDAKSKGINNSIATQGDLLKELTYKILH